MLLPVFPVVPMVSPCFTLCPALTLNVSMWAYLVQYPLIVLYDDIIPVMAVIGGCGNCAIHRRKDFRSGLHCNIHAPVELFRPRYRIDAVAVIAAYIVVPV